MAESVNGWIRLDFVTGSAGPHVERSLARRLGQPESFGRIVQEIELARTDAGVYTKCA